LNAKDHVHVQRSVAIDAGCALLQPVAQRPEHFLVEPSDRTLALQSIVHRLGVLGIDCYGLDLTRPHFAIPVARMIAPALQPEPSRIVTARLADTIARTGGGAAYTGGIPL